MSRLLLLGVCASLSLAKTVVYHFDIGWVSVSILYHTIWKPHLTVLRLLPMASSDQ